MATKTTTRVSHYHVQKKRRADFLEQWREYRNTVVRLGDVKMVETPRRLRQGVYVGVDGDRPTRTMDATAHEIDPGVISSTHRHSWDAMMFVVAGWGWTEIDGERVAWGPGDSLHLPSWAWHRHGNDGEAMARFLTFSSEPMVASLGMAALEEAGDAEAGDERDNAAGGDAPAVALAPRPAFSPAVDGDDPYSRRVRRLAHEQTARRSGRLHTSWDDLELLNTPRGTRTTFLLDRAIGYQASGITMAMFEIGPGRGQSMHRHPGEAWLYVLEGHGHSYLGSEPEGGETHPWAKGDIIVVDHYLWHQHFNDDPERTAKVVRIHMFDSVLETMRVLCDPLVLFEEPPDKVRDAQAGDPSTVNWPELTRPTWP